MNDSKTLSGTGLSKKYGELEVVKNVSIAVEAGEFVCLVGKSGCGKTTLLSILSGLEHPTKGQVVLNGKEINGTSEDELALFRRENVGFIFQSFNLIPTLSAWENVALPLFPIKMPSEERKQRATELLSQMELGHRMEHLPSALSGGEKQRVAIARALINKPKIIFADEPTGNLDSAPATPLWTFKPLHAKGENHFDEFARLICKSQQLIRMHDEVIPENHFFLCLLISVSWVRMTVR
jgi:putative ABC transport system ATP-binding protein